MKELSSGERCPQPRQPAGLCFCFCICAKSRSSRLGKKEALLCNYFSAASRLRQIGSRLPAFALKLFTNQPLKALVASPPHITVGCFFPIYLFIFGNLEFLQNILTGTAVGRKKIPRKWAESEEGTCRRNLEWFIFHFESKSTFEKQSEGSHLIDREKH